MLHVLWSERDREKWVLLGPNMLGVIPPVGTLLHPKPEKPTHSLISLLRGTVAIHCLHISREWLVVP